ncbi:MAG: LapA family protein [Pseudomonadota bacterium]
MKTLITIVLLLAVVAVLAFAVINSHNVTINYYVGALQLPLALLLVITLTTGFILGIAAMSLRLLHAQWELARLRKQVRQLENNAGANAAAIPAGDEG